MATGVFNVAKGRVNQFVQNVEDNDPTGCELVVIVYETAMVEDTLNNADTVSAITNTEWSATNYAREDWVAADIARAVDDSSNHQDSSGTDVVWTSVTGATASTFLVIAYDPTGSSADTALIPLTYHDFAATPNGGNITATVTDFFRAS